MNNPRRILLVDADAFFVAVARQEDPDGAGKASLLIVGGHPGSRGVVCSASYECRAYGVRSAMPVSQALRLCPDALCVPVPRNACLRRSKDIKRVLRQFSPLVQSSSIDEWYCDLSGTETLYRNEPLSETAQKIRTAVREETGLNVSIGCGTSRFIAKIAAERAKPKPGTSANGVHCVAPGSEPEFLAQFRLSELPMIGPRFASTLASHKLLMVADAQRWSKQLLEARLGKRAGNWLYERVRGIDSSEVSAGEQQKQLSRETTFARDIEDDEILARELQRQAIRVASDLRSQQLRARTVTVKIRDSSFKTKTMQRTFAYPIEADRSVVRATTALLLRLRARLTQPIRLLGVSLSHFESDVGPGGNPQLVLFSAAETVDLGDPGEAERDRALSRALDSIRTRYGSQSIVPARLLNNSDTDTGPGVEE